MKKQNLILLIILVAVVFLSSCGYHHVSLPSGNMPQAYLGQEYYCDVSARIYTINGYLTNHTASYTFKSGSLPEGLTFNNGIISGVPTESGKFEFEITASYWGLADSYSTAIDAASVAACTQGNCSSGSYNPDFDEIDPQSSDTEEFAVFVGTNTSNADCQSDEEMYMCLGQVNMSELEEGDVFEMDLSFFFTSQYEGSNEERPDYVSVTVVFNDEQFSYDDSVDLDDLVIASGEYSGIVPEYNLEGNELTIYFSTTDHLLFYSGQLLNIPFVANQDIESGNYQFQLNINDVSIQDENVGSVVGTVDGYVVVD